MLLSHNFDVSPTTVPPLSREDFTAVFETGLSTNSLLHCKLMEHPHWIVEIRFPLETISPLQVGELCAQALTAKRQSQNLATSMPNILVLGGLKTTPPTSSSPDALQPGEWGVDVVETTSGDEFLQKIDWDTTVAQRSADTVFKVEGKGG